MIRNEPRQLQSSWRQSRCSPVQAHLPRFPKFTLGKADYSWKLPRGVRLLAGVRCPLCPLTEGVHLCRPWRLALSLPTQQMEETGAEHPSLLPTGGAREAPFSRSILPQGPATRHLHRRQDTPGRKMPEVLHGVGKPRCWEVRRVWLDGRGI